MLALAEVEERREQALLQAQRRRRSRTSSASRPIRKKDAAQVEADKASLEQAKADYETNILAAQAEVAAAKADVRDAEIDLGYCRMSSPIDGRIGLAQVKLGNLVGPAAGGGGADYTELAVVRQLDPMGVDIQVASRYLDRVTRLIGQGLAVEVFRPGLEGEEARRFPGKATVIDNTIDPTTSTFLIRAEVANPAKTILPGEYVKVDAKVGEARDAVVVPEQAVVETQAGPTVYTVDEQGKVAVVPVQATFTYEGLRVLESGLEPGQQVIVEGLQLVRPGMTVKAEPAPDPDGPASGGGARPRTPPSREPGRDAGRAEPARPRRPTRPSRAEAMTAPTGPHPAAILRSTPIHGHGARRAMVNFFIGRPIFATVLALLMLLVGGICIFVLPISLYPDIVPPQVQVTTTYTGADAQTVADTVTTPIEQQINGVKGHDLLHLGQHHQRPGQHHRHVRRRLRPGHRRRRHPEQGVDGPDEPPARGQAVRRDGQEDVDQHGLRRQPRLARRPLRRDLPRQLRPDQRRRRPQAHPGRQRRQPVRPQVRHADLARPGPHGQPADLARRGRSRRSSRRTGRPPPARSAPCRRRRASGSSTRSRPRGGSRRSRSSRRSSSAATTTARSSTSPTSPASSSTRRTTRRPAGSTASPPARSRSTSSPTPTPWTSSRRSAQEMDRLARNFPHGLEYRIAYDTTQYVRENITEVEHTLFEAFVLVLIVVFVFLQGFRATIIPMIAIPVSLVATFAMMAAFGFSINTLTLCGLVLAIGLVVDDAIIVVENIEKFLERGMAPLEATRAAMAEITAPIVTITPGAGGRVRAGGVHPGPDRPALQPVRPDDRLLVPLLGVQLADVHPGDGPAVPAAQARRDEVPPVPLVQPRPEVARGLLRLVPRLRRPPLVDDRPALARPAGPDRLADRRAAQGVHPDRGPGLPDRRRSRRPTARPAEPTSRVAQRVGQIAGELHGVRDVLLLDGYNADQRDQPDQHRHRVRHPGGVARTGPTPELRAVGLAQRAPGASSPRRSATRGWRSSSPRRSRG